jgi:hypothetical protein
MTIDVVPETTAIAVDDHRYRLAVAVNQLMDGNSNNTGTFTLRPNETTTVVTDTRFSANQGVWWVPLTANAAAAQAGMFISSRRRNEFTITHASNAQVDREFLYVRFG